MSENTTNKENLLKRRANLTEEQRSALRKRLAGENANVPIITPFPRQDPLPASYFQESLWLQQQFDTESVAYNLPVAFNLKGNLDPKGLQWALNQIIERHEILRTTFQLENGQLTQKIASKLKIEMFHKDLSNLEESKRTEKLAKLVKQEAETRFDLMSGPLLKAKLFCLTKNEHVITLCMHHIISDGTSRSILAKEMIEFYIRYVSGKTDEALKPLPIQYLDFSIWQKNQLEEGKLQDQLNYWLNHLALLPPRLNVSTCLNGTIDPWNETINKNQNIEMDDNRKYFLIDKELNKQLKLFCQKNGITPFMFLLAVFKILLFRYTDQQDIVIGSPITNRKYKELEDLIGFFTNTLVFRSKIEANISFTAFVQQIKQIALEAYSNQDYPYEKLVAALQPERFSDQTSIFQILFTYQNAEQTNYNLLDLEVSYYYAEDNGAKFDLSIVVNDKNEQIDFYIEYPSDQFHPNVIERMGLHFIELIKAGLNDPSCELRHLNLLNVEEHLQLVESFNKTSISYPENATIHTLFEAQVFKTPKLVAVCCGNKNITYEELNKKANQLAYYLREQSIQTGSLVGICVDRSIEMMIALLGVLKAGGGYVPIDPTYPMERIEYILKESGIKVLLSTPYLVERFEKLSTENMNDDKKIKIFDLNKIITNLIHYHSDNLPPVKPSELAYVIFTSGSTGKPKGVMVEHKNVVNFLYAMDEKLQPSIPGNWLSATSISFDISVLELFWTLTRGFKVILVEGDTNYSAEITPGNHNSIDFSLFYFASAEDQSDKYQLLLEGAKFADANGFKAIWSPERHFAKFGGLYPNPSLTNAALAMITKQIQLRAGSCVLPLHHPVRVAEEWAFVDNLSGGRIGISFASGWQPNDFIFAPDHYDKRQEIMLEGIQQVRALWRGEAITFMGVENRPIATQIYPKPIQKDLPFWVTSSGNPATFAKAGELGANLLTHLLGQSLDELKEKIKLYRTTFEEHHPEAKKGTVTLMLHTFISDDENFVRQQVKEPLKKYLSDSIGLLKPFAEAAGKDIKNISKEDLDSVLEHAFERYYSTSGLFGTPDSCLSLVDQLKDIEVDEIACLIDFGIASDIVLKNMKYLDLLKRNSNIKPSNIRDEIHLLMKQHSVTHFQCTPALANLLVKDEKSRGLMQSLEQFLIGGEELPLNLANAASNLIRGSLFNMYGPTETTVWSSAEKLSEQPSIVTIGKPLGNTEIYILDTNMEPRPVGVTGEIYIGGHGVTRGYLNQDELTAQKFVTIKFKNSEKRRLYKTGDLARFFPDGKIKYIGRNDNQVKIRGFRIELGEIENAVNDYQGVECAAILHEDPNKGKSIILFYSDNRHQAISINELDSHLRRLLPYYMIPEKYVKLKTLPLTPNGKIDRIELSKNSTWLKVDINIETISYVAPNTPEEKALALVWAKVLKIDQIGIQDNFFSLGGNSIMAIEMLSLAREVNLDFTPRQLFQYPTIEKLLQQYESKTMDNKKVHELRSEIA